MYSRVNTFSLHRVCPSYYLNIIRSEFTIENSLFYSILSDAFDSDFSFVKAWKGDEEGNLVYRKTARNFKPVAAMCGKVCIAEVEELVPVGSLDPDHIHTPGIFVNKILVGKHEKRIENMTVSKWGFIDVGS